MTRSSIIFGAPIQSGTHQPGCVMGPASLRTAGLITSLQALGWAVEDQGDLSIRPHDAMPHANPAVHHLSETRAWIELLTERAEAAAANSDLPVFLGGDHSMSAGTMAGVAAHAARLGRPLFVLWLDAHPDLHSLDSTESGNLHGTPVAYACGLGGFDAYPPLAHAIEPTRVCMMGIRSVDRAEHRRILDHGIEVHDMRASSNGCRRRTACCMSASTSISSILASRRPWAPLCPVALPSAKRI
jgi:arginase